MSTPKGIITSWYGSVSNIPSGWILCDGTNETPDLRGVFICGAFNDGEVKTTSGCATHNHACPSLSLVGNHNHPVNASFGAAAGQITVAPGTTPTANVVATTHTHSNASSDSSGAGSHSHTVADSEATSSLPPYYKLFYIMKT